MLYNDITIGGELYHYGVKGMKWGIRRYQPYGQGYSGSIGKFIGSKSLNNQGRDMKGRPNRAERLAARKRINSKEENEKISKEMERLKEEERNSNWAKDNIVDNYLTKKYGYYPKKFELKDDWGDFYDYDYDKIIKEMKKDKKYSDYAKSYEKHKKSAENAKKLYDKMIKERQQDLKDAELTVGERAAEGALATIGTISAALLVGYICARVKH